MEYRTDWTQLFFFILSAFLYEKMVELFIHFWKKQSFIIIIFLPFLSSKYGSKYYTVYNFDLLVPV